MIFSKLKCKKSSYAKAKGIFELINNTSEAILKMNDNLKV